MRQPVIRVEDVSKQYRLGKIGTGTLTHDLNRWWHTIRGKQDPYLKIGEENDRTKRGSSDYVWALKNISFDVQQGDVVGIIGRNGAGKSTLLKLLSRTTLPTTGNIKVRGRIASLLEVGTGFHPELTGKENIFLNGAILGMTKVEIRSKFDEIVDFAGVEKYIDTPVKRYSSGMYVRLAFAVAAHLEPEILIVDEVLAVGDAEFQKKAIGKMKDVSNNEGRTVLFVSHNMGAIKSLCQRGIFLSNGRIKDSGNVEDVLMRYYAEVNPDVKDGVNLSFKNMNQQETPFDILEAHLLNEELEYKSLFTTSDNISLVIYYVIRTEIKGGVINFSLENQHQTLFLSFDTDEDETRLETRTPGTYKTTIIIPKKVLKPGKYYLSFNTGIANFATYSRLERCISFLVTLAHENETFISYAEKRAGLIAMPLNWRTEMV